MANKKTPPKLDANGKAKVDFKTAANRKFYRIFNNKTAFQRIAYSAAFVAVPTAAISIAVFDKSANDDRGPQAAAHIQQYRSEMKAIDGAIPKEVFTSKDAYERIATTGGLSAQRHQAYTLAQRITLDKDISERDARMLAAEFLDMHDGKTAKSMDWLTQQSFNKIKHHAAFLQEARRDVKADAQTDVAREVLSESTGKQTTNRIWNFWIGEMLFASFFSTRVKRALEKGSQRDNENRQQERNETFAEKRRELEELLKPKKKPGNTPKP